jgi:phosphorylcholine metabolism protein LicD
MNAIQGGSLFRPFDNRFKGVEGYPTLVKAYLPGQITMTTGRKVNYDSVNLDIYNNDVLVKWNNIESVFDRGLVKEFSMDAEAATMIFIKLKNVEGKDSFYQLLAGGKVKLLKRSYKIIAGPTDSGPYSNGRTYSIFEEKSKIYVQKGNDEMFELKNKKSLFIQFPEKEDEISKFVKENQLNLKLENDAIRLVEFVNSIL